MNKQEIIDYGRALAVILIWSSDFVLGKYLNQYLPPFFSVGLRFACASICLLLLLLHQKGFVLPTKKELPVLLALGILAIGLRYPLQYMALEYTSVINASLINALSPVAVSLLSVMFLREKVDRPQIACVFLSVAGVCIITLGKPSSQQIALNPGDGMVLLGMILWSIYNVAGRKVMARLGALQTTFYTCTFSLLLMIPVGIYSAQGMSFAKVPFAAWLGVLLIGVLGSGFGMYWWYQTVWKLGAVKSSLLYNIMPLFTAVWAVLIGETVTPITLLGGLLVLLGGFMNVFRAKNKPGI